ncbi:DUF1761 domain-containing protein [Hoeflea sp.]|uniref:DUF1761 domain-containing protein n=1 Tax=Hoeflea sp. TaxID=1940281 RepID=UPI003B52C43D
MAELTGIAGWLAVIAGAIVSFLAGWLWYSPLLFGPKWAEGSGVEMGTASDMPFGAMVAQFLGLLLMSWFVGAGLAAAMLPLVVLGTLAFAVLAYSGGLFTKRSPYARNVDAGYWIVALILMIGVHSVL